MLKEHQWRTWFGFIVYTIALCTSYDLRAQYGRWTPLRYTSGFHRIRYISYNFLIYSFICIWAAKSAVVQLINKNHILPKNQPSPPSSLKIPFLILFWLWVKSLLVLGCSPLSGANLVFHSKISVSNLSYPSLTVARMEAESEIYYEWLSTARNWIQQLLYLM